MRVCTSNGYSYIIHTHTHNIISKSKYNTQAKIYKTYVCVSCMISSYSSCWRGTPSTTLTGSLLPNVSSNICATWPINLNKWFQVLDNHPTNLHLGDGLWLFPPLLSTPYILHSPPQRSTPLNLPSNLNLSLILHSDLYVDNASFFNKFLTS